MSKINIPIFLAAIISFITIFLHIFGGGAEIMTPIFESELSNYLKAILIIIWHAISVIMIINSLALFFSSLKKQYRQIIIIIVSAQYMLWAVLFIYYGIVMLGTLWSMAQWIIFITISALAILGLYKKNPKENNSLSNI